MNELLASIATRAMIRPDSIALIGAKETLTASKLNFSVQSFAESLLAADVTRLGLLTENSPGWIIADLACQLADICVIPLPHFFSASQLLNCIESAGIDAVLSDNPDRLQDIAPGHALAFVCGEKRGMTLSSTGRSTHRALPEGTRKITFTSGSTGTPRGVCLDTSQQLRVARALTAATKITGPDHLCLLPLSTLLENIGGVYAPLLTGGTVIVPPGADIGLGGSANLDIPKMRQALHRHQPTSMILFPQMLVGLVAALEDGWQPPVSLQFVAVGGGQVSPALIDTARRSGLPVYEGYGLSETASVTCLNRPGSDSPGSVGRPLEHVDVRIEDEQIVVRGSTFLGYLDDPAGWYPDSVATGDLGHFDEQGYLYINGRKKNVLISSFGRNINPEWVESRMLSHPVLAQCFVFGDARPCCVALLAPSDPACPDHEIQQWLDDANSSLPDYARIGAWHRLSTALTSQEGLLTDNGRPRRVQIETQYAHIIDSLYPTQPAVNVS